MPSDESNLLRALLAVAMENRPKEAEARRKAELLLRDCGLKPADIALILGKSLAAVAKAVQRGKK